MLAAVDIGSNTVHMLVAEVNRGRLRRIRNESLWLGLGAEVTEHGKLLPPSIARLKRVLSSFRAIAKAEEAECLYAFATEAVRAASNGHETLTEVGKASQLTIEVIGGEREAILGYRGSRLDTHPTAPFVLAEVGGGSAQIAQYSEKGLIKDISLPIGTGRLSALHSLELPCPPTQFEIIEHDVQARLASCNPLIAPTMIVGSGGVARGLIRALHPDGERRLHVEELNYLIWATRRMNIDHTARRFDVKLKRASTLMVGALVFRKILDHFEKTEMIVSEYGVREGAVLEIAEGKLKPCPL